MKRVIGWLGLGVLFCCGVVFVIAGLAVRWCIEAMESV